MMKMVKAFSFESNSNQWNQYRDDDDDDDDDDDVDRLFTCNFGYKREKERERKNIWNANIICRTEVYWISIRKSVKKGDGQDNLASSFVFFMIHDDIHSCYIHVNMVKSNMLVKTIIIYVRMYMHVYFDDKIKSRSRYWGWWLRVMRVMK